MSLDNCPPVIHPMMPIPEDTPPIKEDVSEEENKTGSVSTTGIDLQLDLREEHLFTAETCRIIFEHTLQTHSMYEVAMGCLANTRDITVQKPAMCQLECLDIIDQSLACRKDPSQTETP